MAHRRLTAMLDFYSDIEEETIRTSENDFVNYPPGFKDMINHTMELENDVCEATIADFGAAQARLHSRVSQKLIERIKEIREGALLWAEDGNATVRALLNEILEQTDNMISEIEEADAAELVLLEELDKMAGQLTLILNEQKQERAWQLQRLRRPTF
ncbi:hypothetical protein ONZ43_g3444 [Nemania bipapillata]|uniref:Uncharacterized protein n=1 Tax=Nemania bipapillata TaxID=110536 RepID=A0ACC2IXE0_9PEZI|nr:hypothetical protein ONZ43_g3444 [Nemania bipapillata]